VQQKTQPRCSEAGSSASLAAAAEAPAGRPAYAAAGTSVTGRSVSLEDASAVLQRSRRTVYYWIRDGRLQTVRTRGGSQRVLLESLQGLLNGGRRRAGSGAWCGGDGARRAGDGVLRGVNGVRFGGEGTRHVLDGARHGGDGVRRGLDGARHGGDGVRRGAADSSFGSLST